jgi:protein-tyrosine phosphatase
MKILFICTGNICRSPTAEGVVRRMLAERAPELDVEIDSAATHDYHLGQPPDPRSVAAARQRGIDISGLRARQVEVGDFEIFDWLVAMDRGQLHLLQAMAPPNHRSRVRLMMDFAPDAFRREVPDPYFGGSVGFDEVLDLLEEAAAGMVQELLSGADRQR